MLALRLIAASTWSAPTDFKFQCQATAGRKRRRTAPPPSQVLSLLNLNNMPFPLNVKVVYKYGGQPLNESGTITVGDK
jgi:hypothetical protein